MTNWKRNHLLRYLMQLSSTFMAWVCIIQSWWTWLSWDALFLAKKCLYNWWMRTILSRRTVCVAREVRKITLWTIDFWLTSVLIKVKQQYRGYRNIFRFSRKILHTSNLQNSNNVCPQPSQISQSSQLDFKLLFLTYT